MSLASTFRDWIPQILQITWVRIELSAALPRSPWPLPHTAAYVSGWLSQSPFRPFPIKATLVITLLVLPPFASQVACSWPVSPSHLHHHLNHRPSSDLPTTNQKSKTKPRDNVGDKETMCRKLLNTYGVGHRSSFLQAQCSKTNLFFFETRNSTDVKNVIYLATRSHTQPQSPLGFQWESPWTHFDPFNVFFLSFKYLQYLCNFHLKIFDFINSNTEKRTKIYTFPLCCCLNSHWTGRITSASVEINRIWYNIKVWNSFLFLFF